MIQITKDEAEIIRCEIPSAHIVKTCRGRKKGKYYASEEENVIELISKLRTEKTKNKEM